MKTIYKSKKKSKIIKRILLILLIIIGIVVIGAWSMFGEQVKSALSVKKLDNNLYFMEYKGDYGFRAYLEQGGAASDEEMAKYIISFLSHGFYEVDDVELSQPDNGCSTLYTQNADGGYLLGRNFDWEDCKAMIVHTKPKDGYESISTCNLDFLGFGEDWLPEGFANQYMAIGSIYVPVDGMNEKGLCIADLMAGDEVVTHQDTDKPDLTTTAAIRTILDYAANVDEAIAILESIDMNSAVGFAHHYAIADATGRSVVVEYIDNKMVVIESDILTNHYLAEEKLGIGYQNSQQRFDTLKALSKDMDGVMNASEMRDCLKAVKDTTQWSIVYEMEDLKIDYYWKENYDNKYSFSLDKKNDTKSVNLPVFSPEKE